MPKLVSSPSPPEAASLESLLAEVARGSRAAFESLYRETSGKLFGICVRLLEERADAEDALQEVFTTVWHKAGQFDAARAGALAWLAMIARSKSIDRLRRRPARGQLATIDLAAQVEDPRAAPAQDSERSAEQQRLERCLEQLDLRGRTLIRSAFLDGSTYEELARRSGSPLGSVKSWIRRGLRQLRECLER